MVKIEEYYLDTNMLFKLDKDKSSLIIDLYNRMIDMIAGNFGASSDKVSETLFNTLTKGGYLKNKNQEERDEKLGNLING